MTLVAFQQVFKSGFIREFLPPVKAAKREETVKARKLAYTMVTP